MNATRPRFSPDRPNHQSRGAARIAPALAVLFYGCAYDGASRDVASAIHDWRPPAERLPGDPAAEPATTTAPDAAAAAHARSRPDLQAFIFEALENNPDIQAAIATVEAQLQRIPQAVALDDPMMRMVARPEPIMTASGDAVFSLGAAQKLPFWEKLDARGRLAAAEVRMAIEALNATRLRVISDVERAFYRIYVAERSAELAGANLSLLEGLERVVDAQYRVGKVQQPDLLRVQIEIASLRNDVLIFQRQRQIAAAALNQLLDRATTVTVAPLEPLAHRRIESRVESLIELAARHNPELAALGHQIERDRESIRLADLEYVPDVEIGFEWTLVEPRGPFKPPRDPDTGRRPPFSTLSAEGTDDWGITVGINLPVWTERIEAKKREARRRLEATRRQLRATENLVSFRVHDAWIRVQTQQDTVALLDATLIPQARQTYDASLTAYQGGQSDFLTVIDNWRRLLGFELMLHRETAELETAFSELQREVGLTLTLPGDLPAEPRGDVNGEPGKNKVQR